MKLEELIARASVEDLDSLDALARGLIRQGFPRGFGLGELLKRARRHRFLLVQRERGRVHLLQRLPLYLGRFLDGQELFFTERTIRLPPYDPGLVCGSMSVLDWELEHVVSWDTVKTSEMCLRCMEGYRKKGPGDYRFPFHSDSELLRSLVQVGVSGPTLDWRLSIHASNLQEFASRVERPSNLPVVLIACRYLIRDILFRTNLGEFGPGVDMRLLVEFAEMIETYAREVVEAAGLPWHGTVELY